MRQKVKVKEREPLTEYRDSGSCHHHWIIEEANGPQSQGICKNCGEIRTFYNSMPDMNAMKRSGNPLELPEMPDVDPHKGSKS